jgi:hemerythrin-like domain-containing protein
MGIHRLSPIDTGVDLTAPLKTLYHSHETILSQMAELAALPALVEQAQRARDIATRTLAMFDGDVLQHHADEENDLFPAVIRSAQPGEERERVQAMTERLSGEHRNVEQLWKALAPSVRAASKGRCRDMEIALVSRLVRDYARHALFEEQHLLPLAQAILGRDGNHLSAVGVAFHLRRVPDVPGYI